MYYFGSPFMYLLIFAGNSSRKEKDWKENRASLKGVTFVGGQQTREGGVEIRVVSRGNGSLPRQTRSGVQ